MAHRQSGAHSNDQLLPIIDLVVNLVLACQFLQKMLLPSSTIEQHCSSRCRSKQAGCKQSVQCTECTVYCKQRCTTERKFLFLSNSGHLATWTNTNMDNNKGVWFSVNYCFCFFNFKCYWFTKSHCVQYIMHTLSVIFHNAFT